MSERSDHLAWCKKRALEYVDSRNAPLAMASFVSDMAKRDDTAKALQPVTLAEGQRAALTGDYAALRHWIEGFA